MRLGRSCFSPLPPPALAYMGIRPVSCSCMYLSHSEQATWRGGARRGGRVRCRQRRHFSFSALPGMAVQPRAARIKVRKQLLRCAAPRAAGRPHLLRDAEEEAVGLAPEEIAPQPRLLPRGRLLALHEHVPRARKRRGSLCTP